MYEPSDQSEDEKEQEFRMRVNSEDDSIVDPGKVDSPSAKEKSPMDDTTPQVKETESNTDIESVQVDPIQKRKKYNPEEPKYPLEYRKYFKLRETNIENLIKEKSN